nr:DUF4296 domain-containing protein [Allomuricauda sp.]
MRLILFFCFGLLLFSCGEKVIEPPQNLIPKEKMVEIYHDLALLNAAKNNIEPLLEYKETTIMEYLYEKYDIDSVQLTESDLYYASVPLEYQEIYEKVDAILERRKNAMEGAAKKKNDSVRGARQKRRDSIKGPKAKAQDTIKD